MATNPYVNKVEFGNQTVMDISSDTVTPSDVLIGATFHDRSGAPQTGTLTLADYVTEDELRDTVGWTGKNLIGYKIGESANAQGQIVSLGNAIRSDFIPVSEGDQFIFSKKTAFSNSNSNGIIRTYNSSKTFVSSIDGLLYNALSNTITIPSGVAYIIAVQFFDTNPISQADVNTYEIMLRDASINDSTFEPYHKSVEEVVEQVYADNGILGAKNILPYPYKDVSVTRNGITFTVNNDGTIDISGALSSGQTKSDFLLIGEWGTNGIDIDKYPSLQRGKTYTFTKDNTNTDLRIGAYFNKIDGTDTSVASSSDSDYSFTIPNDAKYATFIIRCQNTSTVNTVIKPMLRLASDPDDTYVPYAMTNKQLTDAIETIQPYLESTANSASFVFTDSTLIQSTSAIDVYTDTWGDNPSTVVVDGTNHTCTLTFAQAQSRTVRIYIRN